MCEDTDQNNESNNQFSIEHTIEEGSGHRRGYIKVKADTEDQVKELYDHVEQVSDREEPRKDRQENGGIPHGT